MTRLFDAVLFDWDDTICYGEPHYHLHTQHVARQCHVEVDRRSVQQAFQRASERGRLELDEFFATVARELGIAEEHYETFREGVREQDAVKEWRIFEDVLQMIDNLSRRNLRTALISNNVNVALRAEELDVHHHFDVIVSPDTYGVYKPDPRIFIETLAVMGVDPERAIYVGDSYNDDVIGARIAGLTPILIDRYELTVEGHDTEHRIETLNALEDVLELLLAR